MPSISAVAAEPGKLVLCCRSCAGTREARSSRDTTNVAGDRIGNHARLARELELAKIERPRQQLASHVIENPAFAAARVGRICGSTLRPPI